MTCSTTEKPQQAVYTVQTCSHVERGPLNVQETLAGCVQSAVLHQNDAI